jgi:hypothetical protein
MKKYPEKCLILKKAIDFSYTDEDFLTPQITKKDKEFMNEIYNVDSSDKWEVCNNSKYNVFYSKKNYLNKTTNFSNSIITKKEFILESTFEQAILTFFMTTENYFEFKNNITNIKTVESEKGTIIEQDFLLKAFNSINKSISCIEFIHEEGKFMMISKPIDNYYLKEMERKIYQKKFKMKIKTLSDEEKEVETNYFNIFESYTFEKLSDFQINYTEIKIFPNFITEELVLGDADANYKSKKEKYNDLLKNFTLEDIKIEDIENDIFGKKIMNFKFYLLENLYYQEIQKVKMKLFALYAENEETKNNFYIEDNYTEDPNKRKSLFDHSFKKSSDFRKSSKNTLFDLQNEIKKFDENPNDEQVIKDIMENIKSIKSEEGIIQLTLDKRSSIQNFLEEKRKSGIFVQDATQNTTTKRRSILSFLTEKRKSKDDFKIVQEEISKFEKSHPLEKNESKKDIFKVFKKK